MATIAQFDNGSDYTDAQIDAILDSVEIYSTSATLIRFKSTFANYYYEVVGTGFRYDSNGYPTGGIVTGIRDRLNGSPTFNMTGLSMPIETFLTLSGANDGTALYEELLKGNDVINGAPTAGDILEGLAGDDTIYGNGGDDQLIGGAGGDRMYGGLGNDIYVVDSVRDVVSEAASAGIDSVTSSLTFSLAANVENLVLAGAAAIDGIGNSLANDIAGNGAVNQLVGGARNDRLSGAGGADTLDGGSGHDYLEGGRGSDRLVGGLGDDTYVVDVSGDQVVENADEGIDTIRSSISLRIAANVEKLVLLGTGAIDGTGNARDNYITGNSGANRLVGDAGNDHLFGDDGQDTLLGGAGDDTLDAGKGVAVDSLEGGTGNDTYYIYDTPGGGERDEVVERESNGIDHVIAVGSYVLPDNVENLTLVDDSLVAGYGNALANVIITQSYQATLSGGGGDDILIGGIGPDSFVGDGDHDQLIGGKGWDVYYFSGPTNNVIIEARNGGGDLVRSSISFTLPDNVESLQLQGSKAIDGTGNILANSLSGNDASNKLIGFAGNDNLGGGAGDDTLDGGAGDDVVNGGAGADVMYGGKGDDYYHVNHSGDYVEETLRAGADTVYSWIDFTLGANFENLVLSFDAPAALIGTGNELNNLITGNQQGNTLLGLAGIDKLDGSYGNDVLDGGAGNDRLTGGVGQDRFNFSFVDGPVGRDTVLDFTNGQDQLVVAGKGSSLGAFQAGGGSVIQDGSDVLVRFDAAGAEYVRLVGTSLAQIEAGDFLFV